MHDLARHVVSAEGGVCAAIERLSHGDAPLTERRVGGQPADDGASYDELVDRLRTTNARLLDIIRSLPAGCRHDERPHCTHSSAN